MPKWAKTIVAILLLPFCVGLARAVWGVIEASGQADTFWVSALAGAACWLVIYLLLPRPMWIYVLGHELTHVIWTWLFGGKVRRFRTTPRGGHVLVTKNNFFISLAPYFFPIYVFLVVGFGGLASLVWPWNLLQAWFHLLLGAAYAFHLTLTGHILKSQQQDITEQGILFSLVILWCGNLLLLLVGLPLLTQRTGLLDALQACWRETASVVQSLAQIFQTRS
jgi:hypothetical protein